VGYPSQQATSPLPHMIGPGPPRRAIGPVGFLPGRDLLCENAVAVAGPRGPRAARQPIGPAAWIKRGPWGVAWDRRDRTPHSSGRRGWPDPHKASRAQGLRPEGCLGRWCLSRGYLGPKPWSTNAIATPASTASMAFRTSVNTSFLVSAAAAPSRMETVATATARAITRTSDSRTSACTRCHGHDCPGLCQEASYAAGLVSRDRGHGIGRHPSPE